MTSGQTRVLLLLLLLLTIEAGTSPTVQHALAQGKPADLLQPATLGATLGWGLSAVVLLALADPAPRIATGIALLLLLLVIVRHGTLVGGVIAGATNVLHAVGQIGAPAAS